MTNARWPRYAAAALGFVWFLQAGGGSTLDPLRIDWLLGGDWLQHWLGGLYFRHDPWSWPLGSIPSLLYPTGANIGFTDSNPLVAILLKPFAGWLPAEMQLIGPWLAFCFVMQGYAGAALTSVLSKDPWHQVLGGYLFVLSPVLLARVAHDTLCAHFLVLGLLYLGLRTYPDAASVRRGLRITAAIVIFAGLTHPYLAVMCWVLAAAVLLRLWRAGLASMARAGVTLAAATAAVGLAWYVIGYFGTATAASTGFGVFSSDLLALVNPMSYSRSMRSLKVHTGQGEGFAFLGFGGIVAVLIAGVLCIRRRPAMPKGGWFVIGASGALAFYALSNNVTWLGKTVVNLDWFYSSVDGIAAVFRSSGRFIWPLHYLLLLFGLWGVTRLLRNAPAAAATALLGITVAMQAGDLKSGWASSPQTFRQVPEFGLPRGKFDHLAVFPMQVLGVCGDAYDEPYVYRLMLHAYRLNLTFNSGVFARVDADRVRAACAAQDGAILEGRTDSRTLYATTVPHLERMREKGLTCARFSGDWFCVGPGSDPAFRQYLETGIPPPRQP